MILVVGESVLLHKVTNNGLSSVRYNKNDEWRSIEDNH